MKRCPLALFALLAACGGGGGPDPGARADAAAGGDASGVRGDAGGGTLDAAAGGADGGKSGAPDGGQSGAPDAGQSGAPDASAGETDAGVGIDASVPVGADAGPAPPPGLSEPCQSGPGWTLFRFHYDPSFGQNAAIDVWDASCTYSLAPSSICRIDEIGSVGSAAGGHAIALGGSDYLRVRFSVQGLSFAEAAVYVQARSLSTTASTHFEVWSPLYGSAFGGPVDNDFVYDWYGVDWTGYLDPSDQPSLTAIQIYPASGSLGVAAVELCVE